MPSHRSRPIGYADTSGHRILASRSTIRQADSRDRPEPRTGGMGSVPSISDPGRSRNVRTQFTPDDARRFYDRFGSRQDTQGFYENPALDDLVKYADFEHARSVLEFGCGTGFFARRLLETDLPVKAHYLGLDIKSPPYRQERRAGDQAQRHTASRSQEQSGVNAREAPTTWQAVRSFWRFGGCCFRSSIRRDRSTLEDNEATLES
jgi:hypothetical protein